MKAELGGPKRYSYLMDDCNSDKKAKGTKKCVEKYLNLMIIKITYYTMKSY